MSAPVSQMSAAALPAAGTERLALVTALRQRAHDTGASRLRMPRVPFEDENKMLANKLCARDAALASRPREESIVIRV
jgi:hypothetical protein